MTVEKKSETGNSGASAGAIAQKLDQVIGKLDSLLTRVDALEEKTGMRDKPISTIPERKDWNDDPGPFAKRVYERKCAKCGTPFKTPDAKIDLCPMCLEARAKGIAQKMEEFNATDNVPSLPSGAEE